MCAFGNSNTVVKLILFNQKIVFSCLNYFKKTKNYSIRKFNFLAYC